MIEAPSEDFKAAAATALQLALQDLWKATGASSVGGVKDLQITIEFTDGTELVVCRRVPTVEVEVVTERREGGGIGGGPEVVIKHHFTHQEPLDAPQAGSL